MTTVTADTLATRFRRLASSVSPDALQPLVDKLELLEFAAGEALIGQGPVSDSLYLVWDGELDVLMDTPAGQRKVARVGPGSFLGEASLIDPGPATASVVTEQGCTALKMSQENFRALCSSDPAAAGDLVTELLRHLATHVRTATARLDNVDAGVPGAPVEDLIGVHRSLYGRGDPA